MGNRAIIIPPHDTNDAYIPVIYVHWQGGLDSMISFVEALNGHARPRDSLYAAARLVQLIANFMGGNLSIGLWACANDQDVLENIAEENGTYVLGEKEDGTYHIARWYDGDTWQDADDVLKTWAKSGDKSFADAVLAKTVR